MSELYWLYVLGGLHNTFCVLAIISGFASAVYFLAQAICLSKTGEIDEFFKKSTTYLFPIIFIISMIGNIFIPDKKTLYVIYDIGGTLDYLKENKTAKLIPDKAILALDKYLNEQLGGHKGDTNNENNQIQRKDR